MRTGAFPFRITSIFLFGALIGVPFLYQCAWADSSCGGSGCSGGGFTIAGEPVYQYLAHHKMSDKEIRTHVDGFLKKIQISYPEFVADLEKTYSTHQWYKVDQSFITTLPVQNAEFPLNADHSIWNDGARIYIQSQSAKKWDAQQWRHNIFHELVWSRLQDICKAEMRECHEQNAYSIEELFADDAIPEKSKLYQALAKNGFGSYDKRAANAACGEKDLDAMLFGLSESMRSAQEADLTKDQGRCTLKIVSQFQDQVLSLQESSLSSAKNPCSTPAQTLAEVSPSATRSAGAPSRATGAKLAQSFKLECLKAIDDPGRAEVERCGHIHSEYALQCVQAFKQPDYVDVERCSAINSEYALQCVQAFKQPSYVDVERCSAINSEYALQCVQNLRTLDFTRVTSCADAFQTPELDEKGLDQ